MMPLMMLPLVMLPSLMMGCARPQTMV